MKPKHQRMIIIGFCLLFFIAGVLMIARSFSDNLVFFHTPTDLLNKDIAEMKKIRLGGLVAENSVRQDDNGKHIFLVKDMENEIEVHFEGILPNLFREGQGVVAEGKMGDNIFIASTILAKHDEYYMPPEVAKALEKQGYKYSK